MIKYYFTFLYTSYIIKKSKVFQIGREKMRTFLPIFGIILGVTFITLRIIALIKEIRKK